MKVLILGSGAKDHAIAWWFSKSKLIEALYVAPGNPGTGNFAVNLADVNPADKNDVLNACIKYGIDFVFAGTEAPLINGVIDHLNSNGIKTFGAPSYALKLEADRRFTREFAKRHNVPMPSYEIFDSERKLKAYLEKRKGQVFTLKPNSMSPTRVLFNSSDLDVLIAGARKHLKKTEVILEDHIEGLPATLTVLIDENGHLALPLCSEYTKREHSDKDIVTGGMGAICPLALGQDIRDSIDSTIVLPVLKGMKEENLLFKGALTFSIMIHEQNPVLLDLHVRFNDPATETLIPLVRTDVVSLMNAMLENKLGSVKLETSSQTAMGVVIASEGYPQNPKTGIEVKGLSGQSLTNTLSSVPYVFFGAVEETEDKRIVTNGGRAATIVGLSDNIFGANAAVYANIDSVNFEGAWHREDIGTKFLSTVTQK